MKTTSFLSLPTIAWIGLALSSGVSAQTAYVELEPNSTKAEATVVHCIHSADWLSGTTMGASTTPGSPLADTADTFRINTCALPLGIYRHRLFINSMTPGHTGTLCGRNQVDGVIGSLEVPIQSSFARTTPARFNEWYGFGRAEEVYYRIEGTPATTAPYSVVLSSNIVTPVDFPQVLTEGMLTISTTGEGHATNTDLWVYDSALLPLFTFGNDDASGPPSAQSSLTRMFSAGTYYLAITDYNLASNQASPVDDANRNGNVFDFPDVLASGSSLPGADLTFSITDFARSNQMHLAKTGPYDVLWVRFVVMPHGYSMHAFCSGDGHPGSEPCPCGNNASSGDHGCAGLPNASGALLDATGIPGVTLDSVLLRCQDMPPNSVCLFFQGTSLVNGGFGSAFNDGLLCAGGTQVRLATRQVDFLGDATFGYGQIGDPLLHVAGGVPAGGGAFVYQVWYRNLAGPCGNHSNTSNGLAINWGN
ncbi:MAG: hypothetical protein NTY35_01720 [Planctomycetota bacterium]|nr:hypothetical protein [Planctomycetota bacterium]